MLLQQAKSHKDLAIVFMDALPVAIAELPLLREQIIWGGGAFFGGPIVGQMRGLFNILIKTDILFITTVNCIISL